MKLSFVMKNCYSKEPQEPPPSSRSGYASVKVASLVDVWEEDLMNLFVFRRERLVPLPDFQNIAAAKRVILGVVLYNIQVIKFHLQGIWHLVDKIFFLDYIALRLLNVVSRVYNI